MFSSAHQVLCSRVQADRYGQPIAYGLPEPKSASRRHDLRQLLERFRREDRDQRRKNQEAEGADRLRHTGPAGNPV